MDKYAQRDIDKAVARILKGMGISEPPVRVEDVLAHLQLYRDYYDLQDPSFLQHLWYKLRIGGRKLSRIGRKVKLAGLWLPNQNRVVVDASLPSPKREWASFHEVIHSIIEWHREYYLGDTAQELDPACQEELEAEANYGASALMFCGQRFTKDAQDVSLDWAGLEGLRKRYGNKSYVTTIRRFVEHGRDHPMAVLVSTPWWGDKPADQESRSRHFVRSPSFVRRFATVAAEDVLHEVDTNTIDRIGGPVGDFTFSLADDDDILHEFRGESFFNRHYVLTLLVRVRRLSTTRVSEPKIIKFPAHALEDL